jgi:hypothetical protein
VSEREKKYREVGRERKIEREGEREKEGGREREGVEYVRNCYFYF